MKNIIRNKKIGFYFVVLAAIVGVISLVRFLLWAPSHNNLDVIVIVALVAAIALDVFLIFKDNSFIMVATTICYTIAAARLLTNSVGSFVDAIQGINMFGDSTQVATITSISICMLVSVLLSIIASFMKREKV